jgi:hypothetical protein
MANVYSVLSMSSVATVLMGNVQAQAFLRKSPSYPPPRPFQPPADVDRHRRRVCRREPGTRHLFACQQTAVINSI